MTADQNLMIRLMSSEDIPAAMKLKSSAGWNQIEKDWQSYLQIEPQGCFAAVSSGLTVGTATAISYGSCFGWIGMILVDPLYRRRGIATRLMARTIEYLELRSCLCQKLDATEAGAQVYGRIGFQVEYQVERWLAPPRLLKPVPAMTLEVRRANENDLQAITELDLPVFGAPRGRVLQWYLRSGYGGWVARRGSRIAGFAFARQGSGAAQVGPMVAEDREAASDLFYTALRAFSEYPIIVDLIADHTSAPDMVAALGFEKRRVLQRMYRGENLFPGQPEQVFFLAGFEFG